jgi:hypothetical protein
MLSSREFAGAFILLAMQCRESHQPVIAGAAVL